MNTNKQTNTKTWLWLPTVYFTRGLPYVIVFLVSLVFFNRMGLSNSTITLITSSAFVPFIMRPWLGRFVTGYATKLFWVLVMELLMAASMYGISRSITTSYWEISSILFIFATACAAVIHDVAVARYYRLIISRKLPSLSSVYSVFLLVAIVIGMGLPLMLAGNLEVLNRVVESSWVTTFYFLAITFLLLFIYHAIVLPRPQDKPSAPIRSGLTRRWWLETKITFMQLPNYMALLSFLLLFLIPEGMFFRIAPLFLIDPGSNGGLSLSPQELGLVQGSVGAFAAIAGCLLGRYAIQKRGLWNNLWIMVCAITLPKMLYIYLSFNFVSTLSIINTCVAIEQFGFGFGIIAYIYVLLYCSQGKYSIFRFSLASAVAAFSLMASGWFTGILQEYLGYQRFFVIVAIMNILPFIVTGFLKQKTDLDNEVE
ncbi:MFS transporter [Prevotella aurantiaca]|jgi:putative membrane protein|uniref:MFS transporter n=1 Tax=Prevotella aurantiaca TaxID=596085 RepID=A0A930MZD4_9BACT|nr:MFS transporter [Prevotella aurantiaca]MBF1384266.1 MFS transporter [Prevotella aurantiaca]